MNNLKNKKKTGNKIKKNKRIRVKLRLEVKCRNFIHKTFAKQE